MVQTHQAKHSGLTSKYHVKVLCKTYLIKSRKYVLKKILSSGLFSTSKNIIYAHVYRNSEHTKPPCKENLPSSAFLKLVSDRLVGPSKFVIGQKF